MEELLFEENIFSTEESTELPEDWSFIENAPRYPLFNNEETFAVQLSINFNGKWKQTEMQPCLVTNTYTLNKLSNIVANLFALSDKAFTFRLSNGTKIKNDLQLQNVLISQIDSLSIFVSAKPIKESCFLCLSTCCKHLKKRQTTKSNKKKRKKPLYSEEELHIPLSPQHLSSSPSSNKRARHFKVVPESEDLSSDVSEDIFMFSILNPAGVTQFN